MAILGALIVIALPQFSQLITSVRLSFERSDLEQQVLELPQVVRLSGHGGVLRDPSEAGPAEQTSAGAPPDELTAWKVLRINLPRGWTMRVPKPVFYRFSGACSGGEIELLSPSAVYRYALAPPLCRPQPADANVR